jgi:hypothetical protein
MIFRVLQMICPLCHAAYVGLHWCPGMEDNFGRDWSPQLPSREEVMAAQAVIMRHQTPTPAVSWIEAQRLWTPSDFLGRTAEGDQRGEEGLRRGPKTPVGPRPRSAASGHSSQGWRGVPQFPTNQWEEKLHDLMHKVRTLSRQSLVYSDISEATVVADLIEEEVDRSGEESESENSESEDNESESDGLVRDEEVVQDSFVSSGYVDQGPKAGEEEVGQLHMRDLIGEESRGEQCSQNSACDLEVAEIENSKGERQMPQLEKEGAASKSLEKESVGNDSGEGFRPPKARRLWRESPPQMNSQGVGPHMGCPKPRPRRPWSTRSSQVKAEFKRVFLPDGVVVETETVFKESVNTDVSCQTEEVVCKCLCGQNITL